MKITSIVLFIAVVIVELSAYVTLWNEKRELKEQSNYFLNSTSEKKHIPHLYVDHKADDENYILPHYF